MNYCALYRKYRPTTFDEVVGQTKIIKVLTNSVKNNRISHAYLFYGPKGTGKTTIAKLFAKIVNCENLDNINPCNKCKSCVDFNLKIGSDIVEMDAASNNGVDDIRNICDKIDFLPSISKYRVFIIDEVHMLSPGAFNALLKTLEEPPEHIIFILATTEFHKVPSTIASRCQCFEFERLSINDIFDKLKYIVQCENILIEDDALQLIAKYSSGAQRDATVMLEELSLLKNELITVDDFYQFKGIPSDVEVDNVLNYILAGNNQLLVEKINELYINGKDLVTLCNELLYKLKNVIVENSYVSKSNNMFYKLVDILTKAIDDAKNTNYLKLIIEISLLKMSSVFNGEKLEKKNVPIENELIEKNKNNSLDDNNSVENKALSVKKNKNVKSLKIEEFKNIRINNTLTLANKFQLEEMKSSSNKIVDFLTNPLYSSFVGFLNDAVLRAASNEYVLFSLKYDSMANNANLTIKKIEELFEKVYGFSAKLVFVTDDEWENIKKEYINNIKNNEKYVLIEDNTENLMIENIDVKDDEINLYDKAVELFGNNLVERNDKK